MNNKNYVKNILMEIITLNKLLKETNTDIPDIYLKKYKKLYYAVINIIDYYTTIKERLDIIEKLYLNTEYMIDIVADNNIVCYSEKLRDKLYNYYSMCINYNIKFNRASIPQNILYGDNQSVKKLTDLILNSIKERPLTQKEWNLIINRWKKHHIIYKCYNSKRPVNMEFYNKEVEELYWEIKSFARLQDKKLNSLDKEQIQKETFFDKARFLNIFNKVNDLISNYTKNNEYSDYICLLVDAMLDISFVYSNMSSVIYNNILKENTQKYYEMLMNSDIPFNRGKIPYYIFYKNKSFINKLECNINNIPLSEKEKNSIFYLWFYGELDFENV